MTAGINAPDTVTANVQAPAEVKASVAQVPTVRVVTVGMQGPPGRDGTAFFGGFPVEFQDLKAGDVPVFRGSSWGNDHKSDITDGGNF